MNGVVFEQMGRGGGISDIIDADKFHVRSLGGAHHQAPDSSESIDADLTAMLNPLLINIISVEKYGQCRGQLPAE
jgi:hypothetical protein